MASKSTPSNTRSLRHQPRDVVVIGGGPIGLAVAIDLARAGLSVEVLERRSGTGGGRPQLLVARPADLAELHGLGVDLTDVCVVAPIRQLTVTDHVRDVSSRVVQAPLTTVPPPVWQMVDLLWQRPAALVPIARLERALARVAHRLGVVVTRGTHVHRVKRHARHASIEIDGAPPFMARLVVIATGSSRAVASDYGVFRQREVLGARTMVAGVFAQTAPDGGLWDRFELALRGVPGELRCTKLATPTESAAGRALLIEATAAPSAALLGCFEAIASMHGLGGEMLAPPRVFETRVTVTDEVYLARDNRAPIVLAGDAVATGHVFSGLAFFVNLLTARQLALALLENKALDVITSSAFADERLTRALDDYADVAARAAAVIESASRPHYAKGAWSRVAA